VVSKFWPVITEEMNCTLEDEVSESEVLETLSFMKRGKIPRLDGFSVEFFQIFYELLK
jgi:hypothetical protein